MFFKILKKDLKRNKTMNVILFLFIILASIFVASGLNNLVSVLNGTDYYMDKAGVGDYNLVIAGNDKKEVEDAFKNSEAITSYKMDKILLLDGDVLDSKGRAIESDGSIIQSFENSSLKMSDASNEEVNSVEKGHIYITRDYISRNNIEIGDEITLKFKDVERKLVVDGKLKDAFLGSTFMGNDRFLINKEDLDYIYDNVDTEHWEGFIVYADTNDIAKVKSETGEIE
ncbi:MAG: ABC transporter permease, partial [Eubacterium sp.]|nr:ABC transporter permease [Eubacterium sp.]